MEKLFCIDLFHQMAGHAMTAADIAEHRLFGLAALGRVRAARVETAAGRRILRAGHVALQQDALGL